MAYSRKGYRRRERDEDEVVDLGDDVELQYETPKAILVVIDGNELWIPKSLIREGSTVQNGMKGERGCLVLPKWFAVKEGLADE